RELWQQMQQEQARQAELQQQQEAQRLAQLQRQQEEARRAEEAQRRLEEQRRAEEARLARIAEEARRAEEQRRLEERRLEEQRLLEELNRLEEQRRLEKVAEEQREAVLKATLRRQQEEARLAAEAKLLLNAFAQPAKQVLRAAISTEIAEKFASNDAKQLLDYMNTKEELAHVMNQYTAQVAQVLGHQIKTPMLNKFKEMNTATQIAFLTKFASQKGLALNVESKVNGLKV
ncbi:MAG TPA: hypothetical protein PLD88_08925, partial [Candidatus Berkiella sp.]|nr:hypothetical protein [Candidatus Berkiella sp.]